MKTQPKITLNQALAVLVEKTEATNLDVNVCAGEIDIHWCGVIELKTHSVVDATRAIDLFLMLEALGAEAF